MSFERFFEFFPRFKRYQNNSYVKEMYVFFSTLESIENMLTANDEFEVPALSGIIKEVEANFHDVTNINLDDDASRRLIGGMVKEIIFDFGYEVNKQKSMKGSAYIKSATHYTKVPANATKILKKVTVIEDIKK